jgi:hypothetical protein
MFQAEYSSGQPLRMLVDLRASVEYALGRGKAPEAEGTAKPAHAATSAPKPAAKPAGTPKPAPAVAKTATAAAGGGKAGSISRPVAKPAAAPLTDAKLKAQSAAHVPEFEISGSQDWDSASASASDPRKKS